MKTFTRRTSLKVALLASVAGSFGRTVGAQELAGDGFHTLSTVNRGSKFYPVQFWSFAALDLVALDHSIPPDVTVGPGPAGSALALALAHAVIADAVSYAYKAQFKAHFRQNWKVEPIDSPDAFVGGAAFDLLRFIFNTARHEPLLVQKANAFLQTLGSENVAVQTSWGAGQAFANDPAFRNKWDPAAIRRSLIDDADKYQPEPGKHDVDPWNPGQKFYGVTWGGHTPLILTKEEADPKGAIAPPIPPAITDQEISKLRAKGALTPVDVGGEKARTSDETNIGIYWAYDGARLLGTPPPVLYNEFLWQYVESDGSLDLPNVSRLLALCNLAMSDAAIVAWGSKYFHKIWRPVRAIVEKKIDENWHPLGAPRTNSGAAFPAGALLGIETAQVLLGASRQSDIRSASGDKGMREMEALTGRRSVPYSQAAFTPNFPAYPSGHATFGGACFGMLREIRKETLTSDAAANMITVKKARSGELNKRFRESTIARDNFTGLPRDEVLMNFPTIDKVLKEIEDSRVFLGVHWTFDSTEGTASGRRVADRVRSRAYTRTV